MIQVTGLSKNYGDKQALKNINLRLERGRVYGIAGENGAGKTTLFRCIAGLETCEGEIRADKDPLKNHLGLLPTEPYFFSRITGIEYIRLLCNARQKQAADIESRNIFELPLKRYASTYSTGMKKKLALMAILLQDNDYFILDEPFNGVDIQSNIVITELILSLKQRNKIIVVSSHIFSTLHDTCDEIHLLHEGTIQRSVQKDGFGALEAEMKEASVGKKIDQLFKD
ncbi:MAG TPA: ATP-binding cassette domain-containing protein [Ferruginibacter sp.]|nr:ATP-binding cassette domain-containing protein [Ferruginibacter sp.]